MDIVSDTGSKLEAMSAKERQKWVLEWLTNAVNLVGTLDKKDLGQTSDIIHQRVWLDVFKEWKIYAKQ